MFFASKKWVLALLFSFNLILLGVSWLMAAYAYPRLPSRLPLWVNFFGQEQINVQKSGLFFVYAASQTLFLVVFLLAVEIDLRCEKHSRPAPMQNLQREFVLLVLIFFQLVFIHLQRSLILMAHQVEKGIRPYYFYSVFGIILLLIPYYRMRARILRTRLRL